MIGRVSSEAIKAGCRTSLDLFRERQFAGFVVFVAASLLVVRHLQEPHSGLQSVSVCRRHVWPSRQWCGLCRVGFTSVAGEVSIGAFSLSASVRNPG